MRRLIGFLALALLAGTAAAQPLFVGLEGSAPPTKSSDLSGFPDVTWDRHFAMDVSGAAASPDGNIYVCSGAFTTQLYKFSLTADPIYLCNISVDIHGMGYGNSTLYGFSNFASPMGIYTIDPIHGQATLLIDLSASGYRYFGLDFNLDDGLLYGYTEYGSPAGLHAINPATGAITPVAGPIPAANSQGRALAVGNNTVYLLATRGDDGIGAYAYDLAAGTGWVPFTNPYPDDHATGGATWIPSPQTGVETDDGNDQALTRIEFVAPNPMHGSTSISWRHAGAGSVRLEVLDVAGRCVARLEDGARAIGPVVTHWDGQDDAGKPLPSGVYVLRLTQGALVDSRPVVLVR
jgi:hypothetical protein